MATRSRKAEKQYKKHREKEHSRGCIFCSLTVDNYQVLSETKSFLIVDNIFGYTHWDGQGVESHIMIVPKKHTDKLGNLNSNEIIEYMDIISSYELQGYDLYSRAPLSNRKTVVHQHSHLIKLDRKTKKFVFYINKPHIRIVF